MELALKLQVDKLAAKIKHYLITTLGKVNDQANEEEFYRAFVYALREEVMINWLVSYQSMYKADAKLLHYLSMEYLPGRLLSNNILNIGVQELVMHVMQKMGRNYFKVLLHEPDPGLGNGGLGRLASCFLDSLATQHYPAKAYGLRYQYGIFEQQIKNAEQIEAPDTWLLKEYPWEFRRDQRKETVTYGGRIKATENLNGDEVYDIFDYDEVSALPYDYPIVGYDTNNNFSVLTLRLWSTKESPRNFQLQKYNAGRLDQAAENTALTDVLYPSDWHDAGKRTRLKQEFLLVSASLQDIIRSFLERHANFRDFHEKVAIQINDTHPSLVAAELIRTFVTTYDFPWKRAVDMTRKVLGYTNHTIMGEALEKWDQALMSTILPRQYKIIERLNYEFLNEVRVRFPGDEERVKRMSILENGEVRMANLAVVASHKVNGVAELHTKILKETIFKDFYEMWPDRFVNVTNGVTQRRWLLHVNPDLAGFVTERIGDGWIKNFSEMSRLSEFANRPDSAVEFLALKRKAKMRLLEALEQQDVGKKKNYPVLDVNSLFDMQVKRLHEYKRQLMNILHVIMLYNEMRSSPQHCRVRRTVFFAGKSAASYITAKQIIRLIICVARRVNRDASIKGALKVAFIQNYNVSEAGLLIPAADLSEQISTAGLEASGTGNMKFAMNGALTIGTKDGANIEMEEQVGKEWWPFSFGASSEEIESMKQSGSYKPYEVLAKHPKIQEALDMLRDRSFAESEEEHAAFTELYQRLVDGDSYFVLQDLPSYAETQRRVEELYLRPEKWAEYALHNIAGMGYFSTDRSIKTYADEIWNIKPFQVDEEIKERVSSDFREADQCRIF